MARAGPPVIVLAHSYWIAMRSVSHATLIDPIRAFEPLTTRWFSTLYHNNLLFEKENDLVIGFSLFVLHYFVCNGFFYYVLSLITCSNPIVFFFSFFFGLLFKSYQVRNRRRKNVFYKRAKLMYVYDKSKQSRSKPFRLECRNDAKKCSCVSNRNRASLHLVYAHLPNHLSIAFVCVELCIGMILAGAKVKRDKNELGKPYVFNNF